MFLKETIRVHRNEYQKEVDVQISKRRCTVGSYKGEVEQLISFFFCQKTVILYFENSIGNFATYDQVNEGYNNLVSRT
jgi:hypothetical protein